MKSYFKRALALLAALACILSCQIAASAQTTSEAHSAVLAYITENVKAPVVSSVGGEWAVLALARGNAAVPAGYYSSYVARVKKTLKDNGGVLPSSSTKKTEYSRVVIALSALGEDVTNFDGRNLLLPLAHFDDVKAQGVNGAIYALIAFDTRAWAIPTIADTTQQVTRQRLVDFILTRKVAGGGFARAALAAEAEADITAMAMQALAPYRSQPLVNDAIEDALTALSSMQQPNGGFFYEEEGEASESAAQVVTALAALELDPETPLFSKSVSALLKFQQPNGGFKHLAAGTGNVQMATEQAACALVARERLANGQARLYDMGDVAAQFAADKIAKLAAINAVTNGLSEADYTPASWAALQSAITQALASVNAATTIAEVNAVAVPSTGGLAPAGGPAIVVTPKWWESPPLPGWLHWILRYLLFGWIWMR